MKDAKTARRAAAMATSPPLYNLTNNMYHALGDANKAIFGDIYPMAAYRARYGYEDMKKCYASEGKTIPDPMVKGFDYLAQGNLKKASDNIAWYEQTEVVQPVYDEYSGTFWAMEKASDLKKLESGKNLYDIPLSTTCGDPDTIPFIGSISNADDRVEYYKTLMDVLARREGWPW